MSKINKTIVAIKQVLQAGAILPESGKATTKRATKYLLRLFSNLTDCRMPGMICYPEWSRKLFDVNCQPM